MSEQTPYENITVNEDGASVEIEGEIPTETIEHYRSQAIKQLGSDIEVDGFRKGNAPEEIVVQKLGEETILSEATELALRDAYPKIIAEKKLDVIGQPQVTITKLAKGNPVGFKISAAVLKPIELPDYKKLAAENGEGTNDIEVTDAEVDEMIERILKSQQAAQKQQQEQSGDSDDEGKILGPDGKPIESENKEGGEKKDELPELTDELVKTFGDFKNVDDFKQKIRESLKGDKERAEREKKRMAIAEAIIEASSIDLPDVLVEHELDKMLAQFRGDIERMGMSAEDYFKQAGKDEAALREEWKGEAQKRAKLQLILAEIAKKEDIEVPREELDRELEHLLEHHKDADPERARAYLSGLLQNEKVFQFLEHQADQTTDKKEDAPSEG